MKFRVTVKSPLSKTMLVEKVFNDIFSASVYEREMKKKYKKFIVLTKPCKPAKQTL